jgi:hypothetical protein
VLSSLLVLIACRGARQAGQGRDELSEQAQQAELAQQSSRAACEDRHCTEPSTSPPAGAQTVGQSRAAWESEG